MLRIAIDRPAATPVVFSRARSPPIFLVVLPTNFEFVIDLKTANALGVTNPLTPCGRADEAIE